MTCTFFGHRDAPSEIKPKLGETIKDLIENHNADTFYVGNNGSFDAMVRSVLKNMKTKNPHIRYYVVVAYMPGTTKYGYEDFSDTIYPDGLEKVLKRFAISKRNDWMISKSDMVISYVTISFGGAYNFTQKAIKQGKTIINICTLAIENEFTSKNYKEKQM